jgi:hypothetical protein
MKLPGRQPIVWLVALFAVVAIAIAATNRLPPPRPNAPGTFSFAVLGDAPYNPGEDRQYPHLLADLDAHDLTFVIHIGDLFAGACRDDRYRRSLDWLDGLRHPVVYTPGDNEWADCTVDGHGGDARSVPQGRLALIRRTFFADPSRSLGRRKIALASQAASADHPELPENARWAQGGILFATLHLVGSRNGLDGAGRAALGALQEMQRRTLAATAWLRETFARAQASRAPAVVIALHANPHFEGRSSDGYRQAFEPFLLALEEEVERFGRPVLAVQGDHHIYLVDRPLLRRTTGRRLENFTRMQVPGSPHVGWVRVVVSPGAPPFFSFEQRLVPRWKSW